MKEILKEHQIHFLKNVVNGIYIKDQLIRKELLTATGDEKKECLEILKEIDNTNSQLVKEILDNYGWLGADVVGKQVNLTLFVVIQHSDLKTQKKYLPMMEEAVKNGDARACDLALLQDRIAIRQRRKQIYGSQIDYDKKSKTYYVLPIEDAGNVDIRRAEVGLEPLAEYVKEWSIDLSNVLSK